MSPEEAYDDIIRSSATPNQDVNKLLPKFGDWLGKKADSYVDGAMTSMEL